MATNMREEVTQASAAPAAAGLTDMAWGTEKLRPTHYRHACVPAELPDGTRLLFDPGTYSAGFENLAGLDAVLITHEHPDHDIERVPRLVKAPREHLAAPSDN
jgi:L-ascorbate metabolism protein UlaG (beta-lactamase superfamily)